jgi:hypothetical protein
MYLIFQNFPSRLNFIDLTQYVKKRDAPFPHGKRREKNGHPTVSSDLGYKQREEITGPFPN